MMGPLDIFTPSYIQQVLWDLQCGPEFVPGCSGKTGHTEHVFRELSILWGQDRSAHVTKKGGGVAVGEARGPPNTWGGRHSRVKTGVAFGNSVI